MDSMLSATLFLLFGIICTSAQDVSDKSTSFKTSYFKDKLARSEIKEKHALTSGLQKDDLGIGIYEEVSISDLGVTVPPEDVNDTIFTDHHVYYNSTFYLNPVDAKKFWISFDELPESHVVQHEKLSSSYRQATTIELSFDFPFYGSLLRNVTIATGGFLYMGGYLHNWIAATQYIAPLMANFDTSLSDESVIKYVDNGTAFTVLWQNVFIQNRQNDGAFTFEVSLHKNGDIIFAYKDIPYQISNISDAQHPVKVGLSDAYILERQIFFVRRKTVYEYSRIHNDKTWNISSDTALYFTALPTCSSFQDCSSCLSFGIKLNCSWCNAVKRCSDGIDRQRQSWVAHHCVNNKAKTCPAGEATTTTTTTTTPAPTTISTTTTTTAATIIVDKTEFNVHGDKGSEVSKTVTGKPPASKSASDVYSVDHSTDSNEVGGANSEEAARLMHGEENNSSSSSSEGGISAGAIATVMVFIAVMVAVSAWIFYAYKYPQSSSGQFLIKYRPSQWPLSKDSTSSTTTNSRHF